MTKLRQGDATGKTAAPTLKELLLSAEARTELLVPPRLEIRQRTAPDFSDSNPDGGARRVRPSVGEGPSADVG